VVDVRSAAPADAGEILTLQRAAWVTEAQLHDALDLPPLTQTLQGVREDLATQTVLVAVDGYRIVGTVRARLHAGVWHIGRLGAVPDRQGEGIGSVLLAAIEAAAPNGARAYELSTGPKSNRNIAFYERRGYRQVPAEDDLVHLRKDRENHG
jgi:GNAT superfamily N-acetyltransferase